MTRIVNALIYLYELKLQEEYQKLTRLDYERKDNLTEAMKKALEERCNRLNEIIVTLREGLEGL